MENKLKRALAQQPTAEDTVELETLNSDGLRNEMVDNNQMEIDNSLDEAAAPAEIPLQPVDSSHPLRNST